MRGLDILLFAYYAIIGTPVRAILLMLAMAIGVAAVVLLTALGDGARRYVVNEFSSIGTNLVIVFPGRSETGGFNPANLVTSTPRDLTVDDASALLHVPGVKRISPILVGTTEISAAGRLREAMLVGTNDDYFEVRQMNLSLGRPLSTSDLKRASAEVVLGAGIRKDLFGNNNPLGKTVRVGDRKLRVIGVLEEGGRGMGMTTDELIIIPIATAQAMLNTNTLFRVMVESQNRQEIAMMVKRMSQ